MVAPGRVAPKQVDPVLDPPEGQQDVPQPLVPTYPGQPASIYKDDESPREQQTAISVGVFL